MRTNDPGRCRKGIPCSCRTSCTRTGLLALGWHPKHIAGLVRSKWERDYGWGDAFRFFDANSRASFYARLFAGMVYDGTDGLMDHNCVSHGEKGYCRQPGCGDNLADYIPRF